MIAGISLALSDATFGYSSDRLILNGVSLSIPAGTSCAIVGGSGGGKSTVLRLLFRFFDAQSGRVEVAGQDVRDVTLESLREHVAVVPQDIVLFNETIEYNIRYGRMDASQEEVYEAARLDNGTRQRRRPCPNPNPCPCPCPCPSFTPIPIPIPMPTPMPLACLDPTAPRSRSMFPAGARTSTVRSWPCRRATRPSSGSAA